MGTSYIEHFLLVLLNFQTIYTFEEKYHVRRLAGRRPAKILHFRSRESKKLIVFLALSPKFQKLQEIQDKISDLQEIQDKKYSKGQ